MGTGPTHFGVVEARAADVEEEELEGEYGCEEDEEDYGDYGEEGYGEEAEGGDDYGDYGDYDEEEEEFPPADKNPTVDLEDRFFLHNESLKGKYSEVEIASFMKLLGVKPHAQWQDESTHHYKLGVHDYEDNS